LQEVEEKMKAVPELESELEEEKASGEELRAKVGQLERELTSVKAADSDERQHLQLDVNRANTLVKRQEAAIVELRQTVTELEAELERTAQSASDNESELQAISRKYKAQVDENTQVTERLVGLEKRNVELRRENEDLAAHLAKYNQAEEMSRIEQE
jgi:septal ring factor EnvC (AmiA/AmiB activator)